MLVTGTDVVGGGGNDGVSRVGRGDGVPILVQFGSLDVCGLTKLWGKGSGGGDGRG